MFGDDDEDFDECECFGSYRCPYHIVEADLERLSMNQPDNRKHPSLYHIEYFKSRAKAWKTNKTDGGKASAAAAMDNYLRCFKGLEKYDPRTNDMSITATKNKPTGNYIEIKQDGITFRKFNNQLTIICEHTIDYTEANLHAFNTTIASGLEVIAAASKFDLVTSTPPAGVSI